MEWNVANNLYNRKLEPKSKNHSQHLTSVFINLMFVGLVLAWDVDIDFLCDTFKSLLSIHALLLGPGSVCRHNSVALYRIECVDFYISNPD